MEQLIRWDKALLLWINGSHNSFLDEVMWAISNPWVWMPAYLVILYLCIIFYKKQTWYILLFALILVLITDTVSVHLFKNLFMRPRPTHEPSLEGLVHIVNDYRGGAFGFISSHACNYFGIAVFFSVLFARNLKYFTLISLLCAVIIGYSRIYLGVHYPGDILCGATVGSGIGFGLGKLFLYFSKYLIRRKKNAPPA